MFNLDSAIAAWRRQMAAIPQDREALDELECHLREEMEHQMRSGLAPEQAFQTAVQRIGPASALESEFEKLGGTTRRLLRKIKGVIGGFTGGPLPDPARFTSGALQCLELAGAEPSRFGHDFIGTEHVLLGVMGVEQGIVPAVLRRMGVNRELIRTEIATIVGLGEAHKTPLAIPYTPRAQKALLLAAREAKAQKRRQVGAEHILLGLLAENGGVAALVLKKLGVRAKSVRAEIVRESNLK